MENYQFVGGSKSRIYKRESVSKYAKYNVVKSFFYVTLKKFNERKLTSELDPFRERCGGNKTSSKRENPNIVVLVDE